MSRDGVLETLAQLAGAATRIAVDGPDAAGKSVLADELAERLEARGRRVVRGSIDDFLRPQTERYRRGHESAEGYYLDSFDHGAVRARVVAVDAEVLLFDGVFLLRPELDDLWDYRIFITCHQDEGLRRALERDVERFGSVEAVRHRYAVRYQPAQRAYRERVQPESHADVVVENSDPAQPLLRRN